MDKMMKEIKFDCGGCSNACPLLAEYSGPDEIRVEGNCCFHGEQFAIRYVRKKIRKAAQAAGKEQ